MSAEDFKVCIEGEYDFSSFLNLINPRQLENSNEIDIRPFLASV